MTTKPSSSNYPQYFERYISQVTEGDLQDAFSKQTPAAEAFLETITEEFSNRKYAEDKWTIKEVLQHVIDAERVFSYRAMCIARKEQQTLPSFDEKNYADHVNANDRSWKDLTEEFSALRKATLCLYKSFPGEVFNNVGNVNDYTISVAALGFITVGHVTHHLKIIRERYIGV